MAIDIGTEAPIAPSQADWNNAAAGLANALDSGLYVASPPSGFDWDDTAYPLGTVALRKAADGSFIGSCGLDKAWVTAHLGWESWPKLYFATTGNDTTGNGSQGTPYRTFLKCLQTANASGLDTAIYGAAGYFSRASLPAGTALSVNIVAVATGGRVVMGTFDTSGVTFAVDGTHTNTYSASFSSAVSRVFDRANKDRFGNFVELTLAASAAQCNVRPNSWFWTASTLYINRGDGAAPTIGSGEATSNVLVLRDVQCMAFSQAAQKSLYFCGEDAQSGWDFLGGHSTGSFRVSFSAAVAGTRVVVGADNCSFRYAGNAGNNVNGLSTQAVNGLSIFTNCDGVAPTADCINFHDTGDIAFAADGSYHITVNCRGVDGGRNGSASNNGLTTHDRCIGIDIAGRYAGNRGVNVHNVGTSQLWCVGTIPQDSLGDVMLGGNIRPAEFRCDDSSELWLDLCVPRPAHDSALSLHAGGGAIKTRFMSGMRGQQYVASGSIGTY